VWFLTEIISCSELLKPATTILTYSMEQSPSWKANRFSASQEIPPHPTSWRSHLFVGLPSCPFSSGFPIKPYIRLFSPPYALHVPPISFFSILSPGQLQQPLPDCVLPLWH
jgi:hypothetical protein